MDQKITRPHAVYLAAGYGSRISALTENPKCLLKINGETLLERSFRLWKMLGINDVTLVLGYKSEMIQKVAQKYERDLKITYQLNEDYKKQGNTFSLYLGVKDLTHSCLIFDADLIYDEIILEDFLKQGEKSQILVGPASLSDIECAKTLVDKAGFARMTVDKRAVSEEELQNYSFAGEAIGILKFSKEHTQKLKNKTAEFLSHPQNLNLNWEHLLNQFLLAEEVAVHILKSGKSVEIDTPEDFAQAVKRFEA
jgi:choline kinase